MGHTGSVTSGNRIVTNYAPTPTPEKVLADSIVAEIDRGESLGICSDPDFPFLVALKNVPVLPGSVRITVDNIDFPIPNFDNGNGFILGTRFVNGTINYNTGQMTLWLNGRLYAKEIRAIYASDWDVRKDTVQEIEPKKRENFITRFRTKFNI